MGTPVTTVRTIQAILAALAFFFCTLSLAPADSRAITRDEVLRNAAAYSEHTWTCGWRNRRKSYNDLVSGRQYRGLPYNMGGFDTIPRFQRKIERGVVAGNAKKRCGRNLCLRPHLAGVDCSGFIARCFGLPRYSSRTLVNVSAPVDLVLIQPGDILNARGSHSMLFYRYDEDGQPWVYESVAWLKIDGAPPAGVACRAIDLDNSYEPRRLYAFVRVGDTVRSTANAPLHALPDGKRLKRVKKGMNGTITDGPVLSGDPGREVLRGVWFRVKYDNGAEGWSLLRHMRLVHVNEGADR